MLKFQVVAEKTAKNFRDYFFAAPCSNVTLPENICFLFLRRRHRPTIIVVVAHTL